MVSASIPLSTPFHCPKSTATTFPPPPPMCVRFRPSPRVSAASTTAERPTSRPHASQYRIATAAASLYQVLGIQMDASSHEIKTAYRGLARVLHPDVASNGQKDTSAEEFMRIHTAYSTLSDPQKRADYDRSLLRWRRSVSSPLSASGFSGYKRRTWETDQCW
ncbi:hypothetical protein LOK49_LG08G00264 [Camellia lanceoleosa]|uniref:Uncharacterized protein n=1 Tax=Camellia lanceoleosa TaxID=1840588 RepID=A0ACC0GUG4_9ERIC|nr:hypothetical protein LOK49_LG08G00264 [Camellia lanceoleosa]